MPRRYCECFLLRSDISPHFLCVKPPQLASRSPTSHIRITWTHFAACIRQSCQKMWITFLLTNNFSFTCFYIILHCILYQVSLLYFRISLYVIFNHTFVLKAFKLFSQFALILKKITFRFYFFVCFMLSLLDLWKFPKIKEKGINFCLTNNFSPPTFWITFDRIHACGVF